MLFCERDERFGGFFCHERQVDVFSRERPLLGAAEQEQCFGEVDRSGVDSVEAVDEVTVRMVRILAGHVEKRLRQRQRGAQLVGGVRGESLLLGDVCLERSSRPSTPVAWIPEPGPDYARILGELISSHDLRGNLISDAALAALALENGVALISTDTDFARFRGLRWLNPLD